MFFDFNTSNLTADALATMQDASCTSRLPRMSGWNAAARSALPRAMETARDDAIDRARRYRDRADELRMVAAGFKDRRVRLAVHRLAESYQSLAANLEPGSTDWWNAPAELAERQHQKTCRWTEVTPSHRR